MAVRFDAAGEAFLRDGSGMTWDYNAPYTWMAWVYPTGNNFYEPFLIIENSAQNSLDAIQRYDTSGQFNLVIYNGGVGSPSGAVGTVTNNQWVHVAMVRESTTVLKAYVNGSLLYTNGANVSGRPASSRMGFGDVHSGIRFNGRVYAIKAWNWYLTDVQVQNEMHTVRPQYLFATDLWAWWPCLPGINERYLDYGPRGAHWTESGSLSDEDPPSVPWGAEALAVVTPTLAGVASTPRLRTLMGVGT